MFDALGCWDPQGNTVTKALPIGPVTVIFNTTAVASAGTPSRPATRSSVTEANARRPIPSAKWSIVADPGRVSRNRAGTTDADVAVSRRYALTSAMRCVAADVYRHTLPPRPILTMTALGIVDPAS